MKSRFREDRIIEIMKEDQAGLPIAEICHEHGISDAMFYPRRPWFSGVEVFDARWLKMLSAKDERLKERLAESLLAVATRREVLGSSRRLGNGRDPGDRGEWLSQRRC